MHSRILVFAPIFALIATLPLTSWAAGNVLLPSDGSTTNQDSTSLPNLGLIPSVSPTSSSTTPTTPNAPTTPPAPVAPVAPPTAVQTAPGRDVAMTPVPGEETNFITPLDKGLSVSPGHLPTQIVHEVDLSAIASQGDGEKPYSITISMSGRSVFGATDISTINSKLGLNQNQIASNCILSMRGMLLTDKESDIIDGGLASSVTVPYDGTIKNYILAAQAFCSAEKLPQYAGFITEINGRYLVPLQGINCPPPMMQTKQLVITYKGGATPQCTY